jgi:hypothetical protein
MHLHMSNIIFLYGLLEKFSSSFLASTPYDS